MAIFIVGGGAACLHKLIFPQSPTQSLKAIQFIMYNNLQPLPRLKRQRYFFSVPTVPGVEHSVFETYIFFTL